MEAAAAAPAASDFVVLNSAPQGSSALKKFAIGLLILVLVVGALAATAYFLRQQLTDLTGIDLVGFFQRTREKVCNSLCD
jgi:hypothetical protein